MLETCLCQDSLSLVWMARLALEWHLAVSETDVHHIPYHSLFYIQVGRIRIRLFVETTEDNPRHAIFGCRLKGEKHEASATEGYTRILQVSSSDPLSLK